ASALVRAAPSASLAELSRSSASRTPRTNSSSIAPLLAQSAAPLGLGGWRTHASEQIAMHARRAVGPVDNDPQPWCLPRNDLVTGGKVPSPVHCPAAAVAHSVCYPGPPRWNLDASTCRNADEHKDVLLGPPGGWLLGSSAEEDLERLLL